MGGNFQLKYTDHPFSGTLDSSTTKYINIGGKSSDVTVDGCILSKSRRQGVSITSGYNICVKNCVISDVRGTRPQSAIDIEPNKGEMVDNVTIENVKVSNCYGGIKSWGGAQNSHIGSITVRNCFLKGASVEIPVKFVYGDSLVVEGCDFNTNEKLGIYVDLIHNVVVRNNIIRSSNRDAVIVLRASNQIVDNNKQDSK